MIDSRQRQGASNAPATAGTEQWRDGQRAYPINDTHRRPAGVVLAIAMALALAACGGGGSDAGPTGLAGGVTDPAAADTDVATADDQEGEATPDQEALSYDRFQAKQDLRWTDTTPCTEQQMRGPFENTSSVDRWTAYLWNRHKLCARLLTDTKTIELQLKQKEGNPNNPWVLATSDVYEAGYRYQMFLYGKLDLVVDINLHGDPDKLQKTWTSQIKVARLVLNDKVGEVRLDDRVLNVGRLAPEAFPESAKEQVRSLAVTPTLHCSANRGWKSWRCPGTADFNEYDGQTSASKSISVPLQSGGSVSEPVTTPLEFVAAATPAEKIPQFLLAVGPLRYAIPGCSNTSCNGNITVPSSTDLVVSLRCDKDVLKRGSSGCVFSDAAAVMTVAKSLYPEIHQHMQDAFAIGAPGRFVASAENPALSVDSPGRALHWDKDKTTQKLNRQAACNKSRNAATPSLLINRIVASMSGLESPYSASCSSINQAGCQCDEFPFASSYEGASHSNAIASARMVNGTQNMTSGGDWGAFLIYQRVMPWQASVWDDAWIDLKDVVDRGASAASQ